MFDTGKQIEGKNSTSIISHKNAKCGLSNENNKNNLLFFFSTLYAFRVPSSWSTSSM
jgi:hypothetical protein